MNLVLLSGGSGQRLWPLSNDIRSKQFIKIFHREDGELESMVQRVYRQIKAVDTDATVTIATSKSQVSAIHNQLGEEVGISVEPCRRDTFPAIALAAAYLKDVQGVGEEESVVVCPVDPYVENDYFEALKALGDRAAVSSANLVLMGIEPTYPSEKYGYIIPIGKEQVSKVSMFKETRCRSSSNSSMPRKICQCRYIPPMPMRRSMKTGSLARPRCGMCWMPDGMRSWSTDSSRTAQRPRCGGRSQTAR